MKAAQLGGFHCSAMMPPSIMQTWMIRSLVALEVVFIALLAGLAAYRVPIVEVAHRADIALIVALLLLVAGSGLVMKLRYGWSTRVLWEWMFVGMVLLGGWVYPRVLIGGAIGLGLAALCLYLPFFWSSQREVRIVCLWVGAAGAAVFLASSLTRGPLLVLWGGFALYDAVAIRSNEALRLFLADLSLRRGVSTRLMSMTGIETMMWVSHLVLPAALVAQATWRQPSQGVLLILALLIGAWYAIMRTPPDRPLRIMPWAAVWMLGAELLIWMVR
jgi:hypothetical protein